MLFLPFTVLGMWFRGLLAVAILAGGVALLPQAAGSTPSRQPASSPSAGIDSCRRTRPSSSATATRRPRPNRGRSAASSE